MLYKVTGAGHSVCVCVCVCVLGGGAGVRGSEFNGAWGKREEGGRRDSLQKTFIHPAEPRGALFMMDGCTFLGFKISTTIHCHYKAWTSFFNITLIVFI